MTLGELEQSYNTVFQPELWTSTDNSLNGLQCGDHKAQVTKVAFAVDACMESFERATLVGAQVLFVHHGLFWGRPLTITGNHYDRVRYLLQHGLALFAYHLPLDAHPELGNNVGIARALGLVDIQPFGAYKGSLIGIKGRLPEEVSFYEWLDIYSGGDRSQLLSVLAFGRQKVSTFGIVSGGAPWEVDQAIKQNLDVYITGDAQHAIYHTAKEARINVVCGGHYATETWGVRQTAAWTQKNLSLESVFLDIPTGL